MNAVFEEAEDEDRMLPSEAVRARDHEFTLNSMTLLGIFFGLVLICGLCFGLGFTLGRRVNAEGAVGLEPSSKAAASPAPEYRAKPSASAPGVGGAQAQEPGNIEEPGNLPSEEQTTPPEPVHREPNVETQRGQSGLDDTGAQESARVVSAAVPGTAIPGTAIPGKAAAESAPAVAQAGAFMVQIAAVSNPADAQVLVSALTRRGYAVAVRRDAADALLHVQIGPFATRAEAAAMRQKLLADGYNAILKQ